MEDADVGDTEELRRWLLEQGATEEQVDEDACGPMELQHVAIDLATSRGACLSARDLAGRHGIGPDNVVRIFRAYGVAVPDVEVTRFTEHDAELVAVSIEAGMVETSDGQVLTRVVGTALDQVAEAAVAFYVQGAEKQMQSEGATLLEWTQKSMHVTELAGRLGVGMGVLFRHHLRQAIERQRISQYDVTSRHVARLAIGFVDLVGSTAAGQTLDTGDLLKMVTEFEAQAFEVASTHGGRVVKFIGDEIMVAALDPVAGCRLMLALIDACSTGGMAPRGGMAWGEVLFRAGDYYGPQVNLASRLVDAAIPGEVLVDVTVVESVGGDGTGLAQQAGLCFDRAGRRLLKGFPEPVEVWSVGCEDRLG